MNPTETGKKYDKMAQWWHDNHHNSDYGLAQIKRAISYSNNRGSALDVGCGSGGRVTKELISAGFRSITGIDVSEKMIELAKANHPGIGAWTDGDIYRAITSGVNKDGDPIFPLMPYNAYSQMSEQDIHAIIAYIRTLKPIKNEVPNSDPDFPFNLILRTLPGTPATKAEPVLDDQLSKGKYLVTVAACGDCHTPQGGDEKMRFAGGAEFNLPFGTIRSANLTPDTETGLGTWTEDAFVNRFKQHQNQATADRKVGPKDFNSIMPWNMYAGMNEEDLRAIYQYLRTLEPTKNKVVKFTPAPAKS